MVENIPSMSDSLIQAPDVIIYKNGVEVFDSFKKVLRAANEAKGYSGGTASTPTLTPNLEASANLTKLTIQANIDTVPNTCALDFAIDTSSLTSQPHNAEEPKSTTILGFSSPVLDWAMMDHIEVYIAPKLDDDPARKAANSSTPKAAYYRSFVGLVTATTFNIKENILTMSVQCKDMFHFLEKARINTKWSMYDVSLRRPDVNPEHYSMMNLLNLRTKYTGMGFRHIIEKMLFNVKRANTTTTGTAADPLLNVNADDFDEEFSDYLPKINVGTYFNLVANGLNIINGQHYAIQEKLDWEKTVDFSTLTADPKQVVKQADAKAPAMDGKAKLAGILKNLNAPENRTIAEAMGFINSPAEALKSQLNQRINSNAISFYWEHRFLSFLKQNYIPFYRQQDLAVMPIPQEGDPESPKLFEGIYETRLGMLKQMSEYSLYEIYQAHNGFVYVKPPLYNAPPQSKILPIEVQSIQRTENLDIVLTAAATEGKLAVSPSVEDVQALEGKVVIPEYSPPTKEFPFIYGEYKILYPRNFNGDDAIGEKISFINNPFKYNITGYSVYAETMEAIKQLDSKISDKQAQVDYPALYTPTSKAPFDVLPTQDGEAKMRRLLMYDFFRQNLDPIRIANYKASTIGIFNISAPANSAINSQLADLQFYFTALRKFVAEGEFCAQTLGVSRSGVDNIINTVYNDLNKEFTTIEKKYKGTSNFEEYNDKNIVVNKYVAADGPLWTKLLATVPPAEKLGVIQTVMRSSVSVDSTGRLTTDAKGDTFNASSSTANTEVQRAISAMQQNVKMPSLVLVFKGAFVYERGDSEITTGEYNIMQHGYRDVKLSNPAVRFAPEALEFSKYFLYINNANAEETTIVLKTLRPDLIPGFPVLNVYDMNVYYIRDIAIELTPGSNITTTITGIARRRPIFYDEGKVPAATFGEPQTYLMALAFSDTTMKVKTSTAPLAHKYSEVMSHDVSKVGTDKWTFLGWELYGPTCEAEIRKSMNGVYCPPFGGHCTGSQAGTDENGNPTTSNKGTVGSVGGATIYLLQQGSTNAVSSQGTDIGSLIATNNGPYQDEDHSFGTLHFAKLIPEKDAEKIAAAQKQAQDRLNAVKGAAKFSPRKLVGLEEQQEKFKVYLDATSRFVWFPLSGRIDDGTKTQDAEAIAAANKAGVAFANVAGINSKTKKWNLLDFFNPFAESILVIQRAEPSGGVQGRTRVYNSGGPSARTVTEYFFNRLYVYSPENLRKHLESEFEINTKGSPGGQSGAAQILPTATRSTAANLSGGSTTKSLLIDYIVGKHTEKLDALKRNMPSTIVVV